MTNEEVREAAAQKVESLRMWLPEGDGTRSEGRHNRVLNVAAAAIRALALSTTPSEGGAAGEAEVEEVAQLIHNEINGNGAWASLHDGPRSLYFGAARAVLALLATRKGGAERG